MLTISVKDNIAQIVRDFDRLVVGKSRSAIADALTRTARIARLDLQQEIRQVFDRPTPWTVNSIYTSAAKAANLTATIRIKDASSGARGEKHYLWPQIEGGARSLKIFEQSLRNHGYLPDGMYVVPGAGARLDQYGNISRGQIRQVLSALRAAERTLGYSANRTVRSAKRRKNLPKFFVTQPGGHLPPGVWQRGGTAWGSAIEPILIFVKTPRYRKRFRYFETVQRTVNRHFANELKRAFIERIPGSK